MPDATPADAEVPADAESAFQLVPAPEAAEAQTIEPEVAEILQVLPDELRAQVLDRVIHTQGHLLQIDLDLDEPILLQFDTGLVRFGSILTEQDLQDVAGYVSGHATSGFRDDNRAVMDGTLHRVSRTMFGESGDLKWLKLRVGRGVIGAADIISDVLQEKDELGRPVNILVEGPPGAGKTTLMGDIGRLLAISERTEFIDTSGEFAGDGLHKHKRIGHAGARSVKKRSDQASEMKEAIGNDGLKNMLVDEIKNAAEVEAAVDTTSRGVRLIATVHGDSLKDIAESPERSPLIGGVEKAAVKDVNKDKYSGGKVPLHRVATPKFGVMIELEDPNTLVITRDLGHAVDVVLAGGTPAQEIRHRDDSPLGYWNEFRDEVNPLEGGRTTRNVAAATKASVPARHVVAVGNTEPGLAASASPSTPRTGEPYRVYGYKLNSIMGHVGRRMPNDNVQVVLNAKEADLILVDSEHAHYAQVGRMPQDKVVRLGNTKLDTIVDAIRKHIGDRSVRGSSGQHLAA